MAQSRLRFMRSGSGRPLRQHAGDAASVELDNPTLHFELATDDRGEGLAAVEINLIDPARALARAAARGCPVGESHTMIGSLRFDFPKPAD